MNSRTAGQSSSLVLDDTAKRIIAHLQEDGRRAYATIGKAVGLSEAAVRQRVQRLSENGVIQIVAVSDPLQVGLLKQALIAINVDGPVQPVADALAAIPETDYLVICAGRYDLLCEVVCHDDIAMLDLIIDRIRTTPGVARAEAMIYFKLCKQTYQWNASK